MKLVLLVVYNDGSVLQISLNLTLRDNPGNLNDCCGRQYRPSWADIVYRVDPYIHAGRMTAAKIVWFVIRPA